MIKGKLLNSRYLFNRNIVHYLGRQLLTFKHVNCLPEVEKDASTLEQMAASCITHSSQDTQTPEPATQWDCRRPPEPKCSDRACTAEGITARCTRNKPLRRLHSLLPKWDPVIQNHCVLAIRTALGEINKVMVTPAETLQHPKHWRFQRWLWQQIRLEETLIIASQAWLNEQTSKSFKVSAVISANPVRW